MKKEYFYFVLLGILLLVIAACDLTTLNLAPTAPSNPVPANGATGVSVTPTLSWTQSIDPNGDRVTYDLYFGEVEDSLSVKESNLDATSYTITEPLDYGRTYYWQVVAKDGKGGQISSPIWSFITKEGSTNTAPEPPTNLSAEALSSTEIKLTWEDNSTNETGFKIERKVGTNGSWSEIKTVGANIKEYTDSGLSPNTTYYYRVRAYNSAGDSNYSNGANAKTHVLVSVPNAPSNLQAQALSSSQIKLTWTDNSTNETGFKIERRLGTTGSWIQIKTVGANIKEYTDSGLSPNTTYYYRVRAYNSADDSSYSNEAVATTQSPPSNPQEVGHCDTAASALGVYVKDNYAYVADYDNGLVIVDVSNPTDPKEVGQCDTAGYAWGVYVKDNYAYVAVNNIGLVIVDVSSPTDPKKVGYCITASSVKGVYVKDNYAYVADGHNGLMIVDISKPTNPKEVSYYDTAGDAEDVYVKDNYAYVADDENGLVIVDVSSPTDPQEVGVCDTSGCAEDVYVKDNYAYVAGYGTYNGLVIVDVSSPTDPKKVGDCDTSGWAEGVYVKDNYAYVADGASLVIIDLSNPTDPQKVGHYDTAGYAQDVYVEGDYAYVADRGNGLVILDVSYLKNLTF